MCGGLKQEFFIPFYKLNMHFLIQLKLLCIVKEQLAEEVVHQNVLNVLIVT